MPEYDGPVGFGSDGVHYPADEATGGLDTTRPLRWSSETNSYRDALPDEELHNDMNHENFLELEPGSEDEDGGE